MLTEASLFDTWLIVTGLDTGVLCLIVASTDRDQKLTWQASDMFRLFTLHITESPSPTPLVETVV